MRRHAVRIVVGTLVLAVLSGVAGVWALTSGTGSRDDGNDGDVATTSADRTTKARSPGRARGHDAPDRGGGTATPVQGAASPVSPSADDWFADLAARLAAGSLDARETEALLARAGAGKRPGGGLHEVLRRATEARDGAARDAAERVAAERILAWAIDRAHEPVREDRALFATIYRVTRFGAGDLAAPGGSLVRELRFDEAAARMRALRPSLVTWCYDELALRAAWRFDLAHTAWRWAASLRVRAAAAAGTAGTSRDAGGLRALNAEFAALQDAAKTTHPATMFELHVRPLLDGLEPGVGVLLALAFVEAGEPSIAADLLARARAAPPRAGSPSEPLAHWDRLLGLDAEVAAMQAFRDVPGAAIVSDPATVSGLGPWFDVHRRTLFAHAIGADGAVETGAWDEEMTNSWLAGGLPWAPEQWLDARTWVADVRTEDRDGVRGHVVRSPGWEVFTDVTPEFAGQAALVLEAGFGLANAHLARYAFPPERIGARVYSRRDDYRAITHDDSAGHWMSGKNAVLTFLDRPDDTDFEQFRYPTLVHEATHAVLTHAPGPDPPAWLHEGLACFVARWDPTRSVAANELLTRGWLSRRSALQRAHDDGTLPSLDELLAISSGWNADDFGPRTRARYAAAESLLVHIDVTSADAPPPFPDLVLRWLAMAQAGRDPAGAMSAAERSLLAKSWAGALDLMLTPGR